MTRHFKNITVLFVLFISINVRAQEDPRYVKSYLPFYLGVDQFRPGFIISDFSYIHTNNAHRTFVDAGIKVGYNLFEDYLVTGVNAHYNFIYLFSLGISADFYTGLKGDNFYAVRPQIGIFPFGYFQFYYSYSFNNDELNVILNKHTLTVAFQIFYYDLKGKFLTWSDLIER